LNVAPTELAAIIGHQPVNAALFVEALTHGSHGGKSNERDYQRLEFLGDRVLGMVIADALFAAFPAESEGQLSARLNALVTGERCADVARAIGLPPLIRLGKQALNDGGRDSDNIVGDVMEAVIGALYLDAGLEAARAFVLGAWGGRLQQVAAAPKHPKSALLEWSAANRRKPPVYSIETREGPDHAPRFTILVSVPHAGEARAAGTSKQEAETAAAAALLAQLTAASA
jgi:ribonuclease III